MNILDELDTQHLHEALQLMLTDDRQYKERARREPDIVAREAIRKSLADAYFLLRDSMTDEEVIATRASEDVQEQIRTFLQDHPHDVLRLFYTQFLVLEVTHTPTHRPHQGGQA